MEINPFTPTFGIVPPYLAGRNMILKDMAAAFEKRPGDPNLSALFVGSRGCGKTVEGAGKTIEPEVLSLTVSASGGYAYMMQLVGYSMWDESDDRPDISVRDAEYGIRRAEAEFKDGALRSTVMELSNGDINFLKAMLEDDKASRMADISKRLGKPSNYTSTYKSRLLRAGVIEEQAGGVLVFSLPGLREYMAEF